MTNTNKCNQEGCEVKPTVKFNHLGFKPVKYCDKHYEKYCMIFNAMGTPLPITEPCYTSEEME